MEHFPENYGNGHELDPEDEHHALEIGSVVNISHIVFSGLGVKVAEISHGIEIRSPGEFDFYLRSIFLSCRGLLHFLISSKLKFAPSC